MSTRDDYTKLADAVGEGLEGQRLASNLIVRLRIEITDGDTLYFELQRAQVTPARARGFAKRLQRELECRGDDAGEGRPHATT